MTLRRDFLSMTSGAVAARTVLPAVAKAGEPHPDAELLRLMTEASALMAQADAMLDGVEDYTLPCWAEADAIGNRAYDLKEMAVATAALTPVGLRAKAVFVTADLECLGIASEMALSLARDVMAGSAVA